MENIKDKEKLFEDNSVFDKKNILNRAPNSIVSPKVLEEIESGITIEQLNKTNLPVFRYLTQITIHGKFDELHNQRIGGYKNLFQNKNKSIGVKWNAIDFYKRQKIGKALRYKDIVYTYNSSGHSYSMMVSVTEETFKEKLAEIKKVYDSIDTSLFFGKKRLYSGSIWGIVYLIIDFNINAIYEKNISAFLKKLGITKTFLKEKKQEEAKARAEKERKMKAEKKARIKKRENVLKKKKKVIDKIISIGKVQPYLEEGRYIKYGLNYSDKFRITIIEMYFPTTRSKLLRMRSVDVKKFKEALNYKFPSYAYETKVTRPQNLIKIS